MVTFSASIDISSLIRALDAHEAMVEQAMMIAADDAGTELVDAAQRDAPVRSGRLQRSIRKLRRQQNRNEVVIVVGSDLDYSGAVESGTSKRPARPYLITNGHVVAGTIPDKLARNIR